MRKSTYAPATYGDQAVATVVQREVTYTIEDEPAQPAKKASEAALRKPGMKG